MSKRTKWVLVVAAILAISLAIILAASGLPPRQICEGGDAGQKSCTLYNLPFFVLIELVEFIESHDAFFLATATIAIALFTFTLGSSTKRLWRSGERQLTHSEETAKRRLRAYMGINEYQLIPYQLGVVGTGKFRVCMKNFGQTPAIALSTTVSYAVRAWVDKDTRPNDWDFETAGFPIDVPPGGAMFREIYFSDHAMPNLEELESGDAALWVKFCAAYQDIFSRRHEQTTLLYARRTSYRNGTLLPIDQSREETTEPNQQG